MSLESKYFTKLNQGDCKVDCFQVNPNQEYLYEKKSLQPWHRFAKKFFQKKYINTLEVGCGNGALIESIQSEYRAGLELDPKAADKINKKIIDVRLEGLEVFSGDFNNREKFDVVFAFEVIEHFSNPVDFVLGCKAVMKRGGILVGSTPNGSRWWLSFFKREAFDCPPNHFVSFDRDQLMRLFSDNGFKILYLNRAFVYQDWRHVSYRVSSIIGKSIKSFTVRKYLAFFFSIINVPIFALMNLVPKKYLHHGFVIEKI